MNMTSEKKGYKYTEEFGYIPDDWEVKTLGDLLFYEQPTKYIVKSTEYNDNNLIPVLTAGKSFILGYTNETQNVFNKLPVIIFDDFTTESKFVTFPFKVKSSAMKILKTIKPNTNIRLIFELMQNIEFHLLDHKRYWISEYQHLKVKLPISLKEQTKIAEVLGDIDSLIDNTQQLIDKKKNLKIATMQKLLTPKEGWQEKCFEQLFSKIPSKNYQIKTTEYRQYGKFPVVDQGQIKICGYSDNINKVYKNQNGVIVFGDHTRIFKYIDFDFVIGADGTQILNVNNENDVKYIYYMLCQKEIPNIGYNRHFKFLLDFKYCLPSKSEQQKIASILSDMDFEIESLEKEMEKYIDLKIGMMQQLLTGKVRLV